MSQLYYPVGGQDFQNNFMNTTGFIECSDNIQNIYLNIENHIKNTNCSELIELKDSLYKELTGDCNELFTEISQEILKEKEEKSIDEIDFTKNFKQSLEEFRKDFTEKQNNFIVVNDKLKEEIKKVEKNLSTLEKMINFVSSLGDDYSETTEIKNINENIILLSNKIKNNTDLLSAKKGYVKSRIEINDCFDIIKSLNNLNISSTCGLCLTNRVQEFVDPCGHCLCSDCKTRLIQYEGNVHEANCPICRGYIKEFRKLYL